MYSVFVVFTSQDQVREGEQVVLHHQAYVDAMFQCREWLDTQSDRLQVCAEPSSDKRNIQTKLDRLKVYLLS